MRMTKRGQDPKFEVWTATCMNCKSEYEAQRRELKVEDTQRDGSFAHATCEVCDHGIVFYPGRNRDWSEQMGR
jgi:hypothetical protein